MTTTNKPLVITNPANKNKLTVSTLSDNQVRIWIEDKELMFSCCFVIENFGDVMALADALRECSERWKL